MNVFNTIGLRGNTKPGASESNVYFFVEENLKNYLGEYNEG